jgi:hypothetical protein
MSITEVEFMKCSYKFMSIDLYELHLQAFITTPAQWVGKVATIPLLFTTDDKQWYYIIGTEPLSYFDVSRNNCYLGPLSCRFSAVGYYSNADKMDKDIAFNIIKSYTCLYFDIHEHSLVINIDK